MRVRRLTLLTIRSSVIRGLALRWWLTLFIVLLLVDSRMPAETGAEYTCRFITSEQGLSQSYVYAIYQDQYGYLWFGTGDGLNKYDGYSFRVIRGHVADSQSLSYNTITSIAEDPVGSLWLGTNGYGLNRFNRCSETVRRFYHDPADSTSLDSDQIWALYTDNSGRLWVGTDQGLNVFRPDIEGFKRIVFPDDTKMRLKHAPFAFISEAPIGTLWIGLSESCVSRFKPDAGISARLDAAELAGHPLFQIGQADHRAWHVSRNDVNMANFIIRDEFHNKMPARRRLLPGEEYFRDLTSLYQYLSVDSTAGAWVAVSPFRQPHGGLYSVAAAGSAPGSIVSDPFRYVEAEILSFLRDRSGIVWVGTNKGIAKLLPRRKRISTQRHERDNEASLSSSRIRCIHEDRLKRLWVGTDNGLNRWDDTQKRWRRYMGGPADPSGLSDGTVNVIVEEQDGTLLFGTNGDVNSYLPAEDSFERAFLDSSGSGPTMVWSMFRDNEGQFWIGTNKQGVYVFDSQGRKLDRVQQESGSRSGLSNNSIWCIRGDADGSIWFGSHNGLNRLLADGRTWRVYRNDPADPRSLCGNNIWDLNHSNTGRLLITAHGGGISVYNPDDDNFTSLSEKDGLPSSAVFGVLCDLSGNWWIPSNAGLTRYSPVSGVLRTYKAGDGLQSSEFSYKAFYRAADGPLFFGGPNGLSSFRPAELRDNPLPPPLAITQLRVFDRRLYAELQQGDSIVINYDENFVSIEYAALDYVNPDANSFAYRLDGIDSAWVRAGTRRLVSYTDLPPGSYRFRLRASNSDQVWNSAAMQIAILVKPPFWLSNWFRLGALLMMVALLVSGVLLRTTAVKRRAVLERNALQAELHALRAQMNPHFLFNALNSIRDLVLKCDVDTASDNLALFARLVRMVLEHSRYPLISLANEIQMIRLYLRLEDLRFSGRFSLFFHVSPELCEDDIRIPPMLLQPYVENAITHGLLPMHKGGSLWITVFLEQMTLHCVIEDNGIGRCRAEALQRELRSGHRSLGQSLSRDRITLLNSQYSAEITVTICDRCDDAGRPAGTRVEILVPQLALNKEIYQKSQGRPWK